MPEIGANPAGAKAGKLRRWRPSAGEIPTAKRCDKPEPTGEVTRDYGCGSAGRTMKGILLPR